VVVVQVLLVGLVLEQMLDLEEMAQHHLFREHL
jgi:hypothetical protein